MLLMAVLVTPIETVELFVVTNVGWAAIAFLFGNQWGAMLAPKFEPE